MERLKEANVESDHFLVCMKQTLRLKINMNGRTKARKVERWNKNALSEEEIKVKYMEAIAENMKKLEIGKETIHKIWNLIGKGIEEAAGKIIG